MDIYNILKDFPKGTKLYSPICGEVVFIMTLDNGIDKYILCKGYTFDSSGRYIGAKCKSPECMLFPSKENRDWSTFKVESQFPINLEGCRKIFGYIDDYTASDYCLEKISTFQNLILCRDAW